MSLRHTEKYNHYYGNVLVTPAAVKPIVLSDVKGQLKISGSSEDAQIQLYIDAAVAHVEQMIGIALINQTWQLTLDSWPGQRDLWWDGVRDGHINMFGGHGRSSDVLLPIFPLVSVDTMIVDGTAVTPITDTFIVDNIQKKGRLVLKQGATFPTISTATANAIVINYTSGYGASADDVPADIRLALIMMASSLYENRGDGCSIDNAYNNSGAKSILSKYRVADL